MNDVASAAARSYLGGSVDATASITVFREIPNRSAIRVFGTPSAASRLINAQSSKVITLQSSSARFSSGRTAQFSAVTDSDAEMLDLDRFRDVEDALDQLSNSRVYENVLKAALSRPHRYSLLTIFAQSACTRFRGLHEGTVREIAASNPHAAFPLNRAFAETVLTVAYAHDHPDYVERLMQRRGDQPKTLKRLRIKTLVEHITPEAPGFAHVYDELCEITHFGSVALWQPHVVADGDRVVQWRSEPRWRSRHEALVACAQLMELIGAAETYLHNFAGRHILK